MLSRDTRNEKKLKAVLRAKFALEQRLARIDWEEDVLIRRVNEFKAKAQLPELPEESIVDIEFDADDPGQG